MDLFSKHGDKQEIDDESNLNYFINTLQAQVPFGSIESCFYEIRDRLEKIERDIKNLKEDK